MEFAQDLSGSRKAALLLISMGEQFTAQLFKHLNENEVKTIAEHMAQIKNMDPKVIASIMEEFSNGLRGTNLLGISGEDFLQKTVSKALGSKKADDLLGDLLSKTGSKSFEKLTYQ